MIVKQTMIESFLAADFAPGRICQPYGQCPGVPTRRPQSHLVWLFLSEVRGFLFVCPFVAPALPVYLGVWCLLPEVLLLVTLLPGSLSSKDVLPYALLCPALLPCMLFPQCLLPLVFTQMLLPPFLLPHALWSHVLPPCILLAALFFIESLICVPCWLLIFQPCCRCFKLPLV